MAGVSEEAEEEPAPEVEHPDPEVEAAAKAVPPIAIDRAKLLKTGWTSGVAGFPYVIVGHKPKTFRTPSPKHPRCDVRTTWIFQDSAWTKVEDKVHIRELPNKAAKFDRPCAMSITVFSISEEDDVEPDSDAEEPTARSRSEAALKAEAISLEHQFTHRPKNPFCPVCQRAKMLAPQARKKGGSSTIVSESFGDHITVDHVITRDLRDHGFQDERVLVIKDVFSKFRYVYPSPTKSSDQCHEDLLHFLGQKDAVGVMYSDNAQELKKAIKDLGIRHNTSREYVDSNKSVIEREIRTVLEGTRANLTQSGLPEKTWPLAAQHHTIALNVTKRLDDGVVPWEARYGEPFTGMIIPFGAKVLFWNNPKQGTPPTTKFGPTGVEGIFLGYHIQPGFIWREEYLVTPVHNCEQMFETGNFPILRAKRLELIPGDFTFPMRPSEIAIRDATEAPRLEDQDCEWDPDAPESWPDTKGEGEGSAGDQVSGVGKEVVTESVVAPEIPSSSSEGIAAKMTKHDPTRMPDGKPVPAGYNWDGVRLVRNKRGSKRPPDTPSEFWHMYSAKQREEDIARYERKKQIEAEEERRKVEREAPAMPVCSEPLKEEHRDRMKKLYWDKLGYIAGQQLALVARVVGAKEIESTPAAKAAMDKEWKKLCDKACWLEKKVREYRDVAAEAQHKQTKAHFGKVFEICSVKGDELPEGHPQRKWKGRSVFQGNNVQDENHDHAIFAELGSSPASMEAGKVIDVFGSQPGYSKQQADSRQAYTQALFKGVETWVRLPRNRWPPEWEKFADPVCPLRLALYGHPDSGGICTKQLESIGFTAVLPEIWQSVFYHPELDLLLVVYVDDFKMAGPSANLEEGWKRISKVIDMDPAEALGRYFGCHHQEENGVKLPREAHPFAYVFDKKHAAAAAGDSPGPTRTEDYWEVDPELAAVVKHHVYPRKRLCVPTEDDVRRFPTMSNTRITQMDGGETRHDDFNVARDAPQKSWWTGKTYFPLVDIEPEEFRHALAAKAGKAGKRSKAEAKREARQSRFKSTETISEGTIPAMSKPVNVMYYDMKDFLISCVDRYCELAKVPKSSLKSVATPFHENKIAKPLDPNEPVGRLQPIASRVLMKVLFAARMARWDLLRATQSLASRVTKWSKDCDVGLHRLMSYINSSLDLKMRGFIGDRISECKLWMFCDADHAGSHDSKSTSGCALYLVGPNTYFPLNAFSKKQTSITTSSTESEVVAANHGIRAQGLPSLSLWMFLWKEVLIAADHKVRPKKPPTWTSNDVVARIDPEIDEIRYEDVLPDGRSVADLNGLQVHLSSKFSVQVLEDNQATIVILLKGDSEKLRHTDRTQRISFAWLKQQFEREFFDLINVDTSEQVADIFTKPFADRSKWEHALGLIAHVWTKDQGGTGKFPKSTAPQEPTPVVHAHPVVQPEDAGHLAQQLSKDRNHTAKALEQLAACMYPTKRKTRRKMIKTDPKGYYHIFGQWTYGGMQGITKATQEWKTIAQYLNDFVRAHAPPDFTWTSLVFNNNSQSKVHSDSHNAGGSKNFVFSVGDYSGGEIWVEDNSVSDKDAVYKVDAKGKRLKGSPRPSLRKAFLFDPKKKRCVLPYQGRRYSVVAYTALSHQKLSSEERHLLSDLGFRLPRVEATATPARESSRPQGFNRVIVEFCCGPDSKLGTPRPASEGCHVHRVTIQDDATRNSTIHKLVQHTRALCDEGGDTTKPILVYASLPCTGGSPWNRMNPENPSQIQHRDVFKKLLKQLMSYLRLIGRFKPQVAFELPRNCDFWKWDLVQRLVSRYNMNLYHFDGCMFGITDRRGTPLRKAWTIAATFSLQRLSDRRCNDKHSHGKSEGTDLKLAEGYTFQLTDAIHKHWQEQCSTRASIVACAIALPSNNLSFKPSPTLAVEDHAPDMSRPIYVYNEPVVARAEFWHGQLMTAAMSAEVRRFGLSGNVEEKLRAMYQNVPSQIAATTALQPGEAGPLTKIAQISDEGLAKLQPNHVLGRQRALVLVSDSTTVFLASASRGHSRMDLSHDIMARAKNLLPEYADIRYEPLWGSNITKLVERATALTNQLLALYHHNPHMVVDVMVVWNGNELVGGRGVFLDPNFKDWMEKQWRRPHVAKGSWNFIGPKITREIKKLSALQGESRVGNVTLVSTTRASVFSLPPKFGTLVKGLLEYAARLGLAAVDMSDLAGALHQCDHFHNRHKFMKWISHTLRLGIATAYAKQIPGGIVHELMRDFPYIESARMRFLIPKEVREEAVAAVVGNARHEPVPSVRQPCDDPWDDCFYDNSHPAEQHPTDVPEHIRTMVQDDMVEVRKGIFVPRVELEAEQEEEAQFAAEVKSRIESAKVVYDPQAEANLCG